MYSTSILEKRTTGIPRTKPCKNHGNLYTNSKAEILIPALTTRHLMLFIKSERKYPHHTPFNPISLNGHSTHGLHSNPRLVMTVFIKRSATPSKNQSGSSLFKITHSYANRINASGCRCLSSCRNRSDTNVKKMYGTGCMGM